MNIPERIAHGIGRTVGSFRAGLASTVKRTRAAFIGAWAEAGRWNGGDYSRRGAQRRAMLNSWIYTAVELIMREASAAKFGVVQQTDVDEEPVSIRDHPLERLLRRPNPWIGRSFLWQYTIGWLQLDGNAYWFISTDEFNRPIEIWPLPAQDVEVRPGDSQRFIDEYWYTANGTRFTIPAEYIVHFRLPNPFDIFRGLSPLMAAMLPADSDSAMARWNGAFFGRDNVMPSAVINLSSGVPGTPVDPTSADALKEELRSEYTALARKTAITTADSIQAVLLGWNAKEMDFIAGRQFMKEEIYAIFGAPAGLLDKNATEANATNADKIFKEKTIWPLLVLIAEEMTAELVVPFYGPDLEAAFDDIRPANRQMELAEDTAARETLTIDERRKKFWKMDPLPNGRGAKTITELSSNTSAQAFPGFVQGPSGSQALNAAAALPPPATLKALPAPTSAQVQAGNYPKQHVRFQGMAITIENPAGSVRRGVNSDGTLWQTFMHYPYGYVRRTEGQDGEHVDVYLGPDENAEYAYIVHQADPATGAYDEDKVMLGFPDAPSAQAAYMRQYDNPAFFGALSIVPLSLFKEKVFGAPGEPIVPDAAKKVALEQQRINGQKTFMEDLRKWRDKAVKAFKSGGNALVKFESEAIPFGVAAEIRARLVQADTLDEVKAIFSDQLPALTAAEVAAAEFFQDGFAHRYQGYPLAAAVEPV